ncbi:MAG: hypothetical protein WKF77_03770 [Planctomycetaceae bacterium]
MATAITVAATSKATIAAELCASKMLNAERRACDNELGPYCASLRVTSDDPDPLAISLQPLERPANGSVCFRR